ncbi:ubiquinone biosynthesis protein COQ9 [Sphingomonas gellani]|uniref:Ubiquinone biosynthesis protein COQ9 n=1 Tax=Sphingomonas gellani TaxID=1166340 RepID=A0A1H8JLD2_9SPHN|nr:COQ9 family protein [Sphingomonas gellani]SEN81472.1 ubiquinone biosynthesis protein COQ9 [Sphingomonas gellani]
MTPHADIQSPADPLNPGAGVSSAETVDLTLDEVRALLAPDIAANAAFDGWGDEALHYAADAKGVDRDVARLAFAGGPTAMIDAWFAAMDAAMDAALPAEAIARMKIRERITRLVEARLTFAAPHRDALRRALAILALPTNVAFATRLGWRTVDHIWRRAGDTATDYNHYTKRGILLGVYGATITVFLDDESEGWADTRAFLARRIEGIMRFEKAKAGFVNRAIYRPSLSRFVGRLRYPVV